MTVIDNSKIFLEGMYSDVNVKIPANTTFQKGLVLGRDSEGDLTAFSSENEGSEPLYILAQTLVNDSKSDVEITLARVFEGGAVNKDKIVFSKAADASDNDVFDALKRNGFSLETVVEMTERTSLAE